MWRSVSRGVPLRFLARSLPLAPICASLTLCRRGFAVDTNSDKPRETSDNGAFRSWLHESSTQAADTLEKIQREAKKHAASVDAFRAADDVTDYVDAARTFLPSWLQPPSNEELDILRRLRKSSVQFSKRLGSVHDEPVSLSDLLPTLQKLMQVRLQALEEYPDVFAHELRANSIPEATGHDVQLLSTLMPFADHAYDTDVRPWVESQEGWELLHQEPDGDVEQPGYFIAFNPASNRAIVAIKGTSSLADVVTDIIHATEPLPNGGHAHSGIAQAGRFVLNRVSPILLNLLDNYDVTIVGHSLGAGAAVLMGQAMRDDPRFDKLQYNVVGIACPAVVDKVTARDMRQSGMFTVAVNQDDVVPRASLHNARLAQIFLESLARFEIAHPETDMLGKVTQVFLQQLQALHAENFSVTENESVSVMGFPSPAELVEFGLLDASSPLNEDGGIVPHDEDLFVPGKVVYLRQSHPTSNDTPGECHAYLCDGEFTGLRRIEVSRTMVHDHLMDAYIDAIESVHTQRPT